jgi:hypothetical protein
MMRRTTKKDQILFPIRMGLNINHDAKNAGHKQQFYQHNQHSGLTLNQVPMMMAILVTITIAATLKQRGAIAQQAIWIFAPVHRTPETILTPANRQSRPDTLPARCWRSEI